VNIYKPLMGDVKAVRSPTTTSFSYPSTSGNEIIKFMIVVLVYVYFYLDGKYQFFWRTCVDDASNFEGLNLVTP